MLMSGLFGEDLFDDFWGFPSQHELANIDKRLYGKHARHMMETDVHETDTEYELLMNLPGFKKDQINVKLEDGYMTISASKDHDQEKKDKQQETTDTRAIARVFSFKTLMLPGESENNNCLRRG